MTSKTWFTYNHLILGRLRPERLTSIQMVSQKCIRFALLKLFSFEINIAIRLAPYVLCPFMYRAHFVCVPFVRMIDRILML